MSGLTRASPCQSFLEGGPSPHQVEGDEAEDDDAQGQQDALGAVDVGHRPQAARGDVQEDDHRQQDRSSLDGAEEGLLQGRALHQAGEQQARGAQLDAEIGNGEDHGHEHREHPHPVGAVVVGEHLAGGDVSVPPPQQPLSLEEQHPGEGNGDGVEGGEGVGQADVEYRPRMADEGPARERGGRGGEDEDPQADGPPGDEVVARGAGLAGPAHPPVDAVRPVSECEHREPSEFFHGLQPFRFRIRPAGFRSRPRARWPGRRRRCASGCGGTACVPPRSGRRESSCPRAGR